MKLQVQPCVPADLDKASTIYGPENGDLCSPLMDIVMPLNDSNARSRAKWSCKQQKDILETDPTTHFVKVVDTDKDDEIVALGRWHKYPQGYFENGPLEYGGLKGDKDPRIYPEGFNVPFYYGLLNALITARRGRMGEGPYWVLTTIETRGPLRKNGAGSLILKWGLEQAAKDGMPAYLEAVENAVGLYKKHGFREVGRQHVDASSYGLDGVEFELLRMRADPK